MNKTKSLISLVLVLSLLIGQVGIVFAAPDLQKSTLITGTVHSLTLETDPNTGITTVIVEVTGKNQTLQTLRIGQTTAVTIGLVSLDGDGNPVINNLALGKRVEIDAAAVIPDKQQDRNPVGNALATFFSDIAEYDTVMAAHRKGISFSVIAQVLWLTKKLDGDPKVFQSILDARETGDYRGFTFDGVAPKNWQQLRKAILDGKKLDKAASKPDNGNNDNNGKNKNKNKGNDKDKKGNDSSGNNENGKKK